MPTDTSIDATTLGALVTRHAAALGASTAAARSAALQAVQLEVNAAADLELRALQQSITQLEVLRQQQHEAAAATAERARLARASALLTDIFAKHGEHTLAALIHGFRLEPSRHLASLIRTRWDTFNGRCLGEVGVELATDVLGCLVVDDIVAEPGYASAINTFGASDFFGGTSMLYSVFEVTRAPDAESTKSRLVDAEGLLLAEARRWLAAHVGEQPDPANVARHALRRQYATRGDLTAAREQFDRVQGEAREAAFRASYTPPESDVWSAVLRTFGVTPAA